MAPNKNITEVVSLYQRVAQNTLNNPASLWLNLGLWDETNDVNIACKNLFDKAIRSLNITKDSKLFDAGIGYGIQDIYLAEKVPGCIIKGVNIVNFQLDRAIKLVEEKNLQKSVILTNEDATSTSFDADEFDFVIAIESAFHFNTRYDFFKEAFRVLKPGGTIAIADCLPRVDFVMDEEFMKAASSMAIPFANCYNINEYKNLMKKAGYRNILEEDITDLVLPSASIEMFSNTGWRSVNKIDNMNQLNSAFESLEKFIKVTTIGKYYIITATK